MNSHQVIELVHLSYLIGRVKVCLFMRIRLILNPARQENQLENDISPQSLVLKHTVSPYIQDPHLNGIVRLILHIQKGLIPLRDRRGDYSEGPKI